jgi:hypothetical protein
MTKVADAFFGAKDLFAKPIDPELIRGEWEKVTPGQYAKFLGEEIKPLKAKIKKLEAESRVGGEDRRAEALNRLGPLRIERDELRMARSVLNAIRMNGDSFDSEVIDDSRRAYALNVIHSHVLGTPIEDYHHKAPDPIRESIAKILKIDPHTR